MTRAPEVKLSRIERMLNAFTYVSRKAVRLDDATDKYLAVIKEGLAEAKEEGRQEALAALPLPEEARGERKARLADVVLRGDYDHSIHSNPDAAAWAQFFSERFPEGSPCPDEGTMIGYFANAMMAMHDFGPGRTPPAPPAATREHDHSECPACLGEALERTLGPPAATGRTGGTP